MNPTDFPDSKPSADVTISRARTTDQGGDDASRRGRRYRRGGNNLMVIKQSKFDGRCEDLKGHIYDCTDGRQADQYSKTTKEIAEFIGRTYKFGMDARLTLENLEPIVLETPEDPLTTATRTEIRIWEKLVDEYVTRRTLLRENIKTAYSLIWGQCSDLMRQRLEANESFNQISTKGDAIELLRMIKNTTYDYQSQKSLAHAIHDAKKRLYAFYQPRHMSTQAYYEQFINLVDVVNHIGGSYGIEPGILDQYAASKGKSMGDLDENDRLCVKDQYLAIAFVTGADRTRFGRLIEKLQNDYLQGYDGYPKTLSTAYQLLTNWKQESFKSSGITNDGVAFATHYQKSHEGESKTGNAGSKSHNKNDKSKIICHKCGISGHYANECMSTNKASSTTNTLDSESQPGPSNARINMSDNAAEVMLMTNVES